MTSLPHFLFALAVLVGQTSSWTVEVPPRSKFCAYEKITDSGFEDDTMPANDSMVFYYQVLSGGEHNKISFTFNRYDQTSGKLHNFGSDMKKERNYVKVAYLDGLYEMCLINDDIMSTKTVACHLTPPLDRWSLEYNQTNTPPSDVMLIEIANSMIMNLMNLTQTVRMDRYKNFQAFKSSVVLSSRVSFWSQFITVSILLTAAGQVFALRRLFNQPQTGSRRLLNSAT